MNRSDYLAEQRAQGAANAHAAVAAVREWGGCLERTVLRRLRLGRGANRATRARLLVRQGSRYVLPDPLTTGTP